MADDRVTVSATVALAVAGLIPRAQVMRVLVEAAAAEALAQVPAATQAGAVVVAVEQSTPLVQQQRIRVETLFGVAEAEAEQPIQLQAELLERLYLVETDQLELWTAPHLLVHHSLVADQAALRAGTLVLAATVNVSQPHSMEFK